MKRIDRDLLKFLFSISIDPNYEPYKNSIKIRIIRDIIVFAYCIIFFNVLLLLSKICYEIWKVLVN